MAAASYYSTVQKAYIAFYGRPADPNGLTYWAHRIDAAGGNISSIIQSFGTSAEASSLYGSLSNAAAVNALYLQIFGRDADVTGLNFYVGKLLDGSYTLVDIAQRVIDGASGSDATIVENKLTAAQAYTNAIDTTSEVLAYTGNDAAESARAWLSTVSSTSTSLTNAQAGIDTALTSLSTGSAVASFSYSSGSDLLSGTTGSDVFVGNAGAVSNSDIVDGKAGIDTLRVYLGSGLSSDSLANVSNVERLELAFLASETGAQLDLAQGVDGATSIKVWGTFDATGGIGDFDTGATITIVSGAAGELVIDRSNTADAINLVIAKGSASLELTMSGVELASALNLTVYDWTNTTADAIQLNSAFSSVNIYGSVMCVSV